VPFIAMVMRRGERRPERSKWTWKAVGLSALGFFLLLLITGLVVRAMLFHIPSELEESVEGSKALTEPGHAPGVPEGNVYRQFREFSAREGPAELRLSEDEVEALLRRRLPMDSVRNLEIDLDPGRVRASGLVRIKGRWVYVEAEGRLSLEGRRAVKFELEGVKVGKLPLPGFVKRRIERRLREFRIFLPVPADAVEVGEGVLVLRRWGP